MSVVPQVERPCSVRRALVQRNCVLFLHSVSEVEVVELVSHQHLLFLNGLITLSFSSLYQSERQRSLRADVEIRSNLHKLTYS